ncbi:MAG: hypothetical protein ABW089_00265 [Sedimenticola sp.]
MSRVTDVPVYVQREAELPSSLYNLWRRARNRLTLPVRFPLDDHHGMVMIVEENELVCVNELQNDLPYLAWVEFDDKGRDALHTPVKCKLNYYHYAASKFRAKSLEQMQRGLDQLLSK